MQSSMESLEKTAANGIEKAKDLVEQELTALWDALPDWQRDNHYIISGYRHASGSHRKSAASLGYLHNETVNIYSHLVPSIVFAIVGLVLWTTFLPRYQAATHNDVYVFGCFLSGAMICLGMSAAYHTISNHSQKVQKFGNKLDYLGIVFLIWGSFIPSIYYGFTCAPNLVKVYWTMITTIGAGCAVVTTSPQFATPDWRPFRAFMFVAMGLSAIIPVIHGVNMYGVARMENLIGLRWLIIQGFLYVLGAVIYAMRVPERFKPGTFDLFGSSHQIFHVLVVLAAISHMVGLIKAFDYHYSHSVLELCLIDPATRQMASVLSG